jgi:hypothetical protein
MTKYSIFRHTPEAGDGASKAYDKGHYLTWSTRARSFLASPVFPAGAPARVRARLGLSVVGVIIGRPFHASGPKRAEALGPAHAPASQHPPDKKAEERNGRHREAEPVRHVVRHRGAVAFLSVRPTKNPPNGRSCVSGALFARGLGSESESLFRKSIALVLRRPEGASKDVSSGCRRRRQRPLEHPSRPFAFAKGASG